MSDRVLRVQQDAHGVLSLTAFASTLPVLLNEKGVTESDIENAIKVVTKKGGKIGAALLVDRPFRDNNSPDLDAPQWLVRLPISAYELPTINRGAAGTGYTIEDLISETCIALHGLYIEDLGCTVTCAKENVSPVLADGLLVAEMFFECTVQAQVLNPRVAKPQIGGSASAVTLICPTSGSAILYSTNGSFPDTPYTAPFAVQSGDLVRAIATKTGHRSSYIASHIF